MESEKIVVLLVEDNSGDVRLIQEMLAESGEADYQLEHADRLSQGLERFLDGGIDVVLLDLSLPDSHGLETLGKVRAQASAVPIIVLTGLNDEMTAVEAVRQGAQDYLIKGDVDSKLLRRAVRYSLERKRAEDQALVANERLQYLLSASSAVIYASKTSGDYSATFISDNVIDMTGYEAHDFLDDPSFWIDHIHPDDIDRVKGEAAQIFDKGVHSYDYRFQYKDGRYIWVRDDMKLVRNTEGEPIEIVGFWTDISYRKQAVETLRESEERYRLLAENVTDVIWTMDMNLQLTYVSPSITRQRGFSVEEAMTRGIEKDLTPASLEISIKAFSEGLAAEKMESKDLSRTWTLECEVYCKDGSTIWAEQEITFLRDADGHPVGILGVSRDITERKRAEKELRNSEEKMRQLFRSATDGIFTVDLNGVYTEVNERMLELLNIRFKDQILGRNYLEFVNAPDIKMAIVEMQRTLEYGVVMHMEYTSLRADFSDFYAELNGAPLRDASNRAVGFVGILRDITERKKIATMKSGYISIISHQLKTPVVGIKMGIENMLEGLTGDLTTKQKQYLKAMYEICSRNHRLVNALINVSIIDRGELFVDIEPVKLMEIVDLALVDYRNDIRKKGLTLNIEEVDKGIVVLADIDKMVEALSNVINNAVKFTDKGSIAIRITDGLTTESKYAIVEVRDTGTGMSDEVLNNLLTRRKVLSGPPIASDGVGIGLWIAKSFMEAQRGDVRATSVAGEGSTFVLRVPRVLRGQSEKTHEVKEYEHHQ